MSLQYPLLFIHGESGWSRDLRLQGNGSNRNNTLTRNMFYYYQLHDRANTYSLLLRGGRLFQQYLVDAYVCIEQDRLNFHRYNQNALRSEYMQGIHDAVTRGDTEGKDIGKRIILPSTFTGGPRYMYKHYQDALAMCRVHGNPKYFITFTCNIKWPEIRRYIAKFPILKPEDRPDVIARVFHMKVTSFVNFLKVRRPFGKVTVGNLSASYYIENSISVIEAYSCYLKAVRLCYPDLYTIEFQKRGLPHCHLLLWVDEAHKIKNAAQLDAYIAAEIPDPIKEPTLYTIVIDSMIHGPCSIAKPNSPCMALGSCKKNFPKDYEPVTRFDDNGYARYKRHQSTHSVQKNGISLDNGYVVPYNLSHPNRWRNHRGAALSEIDCPEVSITTIFTKYLKKHVPYHVINDNTNIT
ncbi:putative helitron helicase-like domain-containing protein [Helianthus annuus]|nr:putative helitron helicase-like domain-containing protein [Helianthus annuus]